MFMFMKKLQDESVIITILKNKGHMTIFSLDRPIK